jgi:hypothetical protein
VADAIKVAREMALVPYANRVTTQRSNKSDRGERPGRAEGPMPRPSAPPPPPRADEEGDETTGDGSMGEETTFVEAAVDPAAVETSEVTES